MPAEGIHLTALREAMIAPELAAPVRGRLIRRDDAARLGALLPDLPYFDNYALEVARYVAGVPARPSRWGAAIHEGGAVALLGGLLAVARRERDETLSAIALGLASHCAIDRALHPLVNALARLHRGGKNHDASHREVEKFQSICFHEQYLGRDTMGTPAITGNLTIHLAGLLADQLEDRLGAQLREAWALALGDAPTDRELAGFARGYRYHTRLLGSSLGKRVASPAEKEAARPRYLYGPWGSFEQLFAQAVAASVPVLDATGAVLDATEAELPAARALLEALLPQGTIDPQGEALDLAVPVAIALS